MKKPQTPNGPLLTVAEAAERLGVTIRTIYNYIQEGILISCQIKPHGYHFIPEWQIDELLKIKKGDVKQ